MAVELGGISLSKLTRVLVAERARMIHHEVPGMSGALIQTAGRPSVVVSFNGIFYGEGRDDELKKLRDAYRDHNPVDFFTEAVGEGYFAQVLILKLDVSQSAGYPDQYEFFCKVAEYVEPPQPVSADPFPALDMELLGEATAFVDDMQNAIEQVSELADLIAAIPDFGNPTTKLPEMPKKYIELIDTGTTALTSARELF